LQVFGVEERDNNLPDLLGRQQSAAAGGLKLIERFETFYFHGM
jgi:hypothetical protein